MKKNLQASTGRRRLHALLRGWGWKLRLVQTPARCTVLTNECKAGWAPACSVQEYHCRATWVQLAALARGAVSGNSTQQQGQEEGSGETWILSLSEGTQAGSLEANTGCLLLFGATRSQPKYQPSAQMCLILDCSHLETPFGPPFTSKTWWMDLEARGPSWGLARAGWLVNEKMVEQSYFVFLPPLESLPFVPPNTARCIFEM